MVRHWVFVTTPDNLVVCLKHGVFGVDPSKYGIAAQSLIRVDDLFFFLREVTKRAKNLIAGLQFNIYWTIYR